LKRSAKRFEVRFAHEFGPARFDTATSGHGNWAYGFAALGQEHQSSASVVRVSSSLDVAELLELVDELRSLLVEHATLRSPGGSVAGLDAIVAQAARIHSATADGPVDPRSGRPLRPRPC